MKKINFGIGTIENLKDILIKESPKKIFLVTGKKSYETSGAKKLIESILENYKYIQFNDFTANPKDKDIEKGMKLFKKEKCDLVITIGGGSVIDIGKAINIISAQKKSKIKDVEIKNKGAPLIAIPTTSGTGSEGTHFSVVYINKVKHSLMHKHIFPDYIILDPSLTFTLPKRIVAETGMDALSQAVESYWSIHSTKASKEYSKAAIKLILENLEDSVNKPTKRSRAQMMKAAYYAGRAINITRTTAPHAISYPITSHFNIPHGHAVALTLGEVLVFNSQVTEKDCLDLRGSDYVKKSIEEINKLFKSKSAEETHNKIKELMKNIGLETSLEELKITKKKDIDLIVKNGFNPQRVKNNPRELTEPALRSILNQRDIPENMTKFDFKLAKKSNLEYSDRIFRWLSNLISKPLIKFTNVTPNQITMFSFLLGIIAAYFLFKGGYTNLVIGGILAFARQIFDQVDGEIARVKKIASDMGKWLDGVTGFITEELLIIALALGIGTQLSLILGMLAAIAYPMQYLLVFFYKHDILKKFDKIEILKSGKFDFLRYVYGSSLFYLLLLIAVIINKPLWVLFFFATAGNLFWIMTVFLQYLNIRRASQSS